MVRFPEGAACVGQDPTLFDTLTQPEARSCSQGCNAYTIPRIRAAVRICAVCPIRRQCSEYAAHHNLQGVWGGQYLSRQSLRDKGVAA